MKKGSRKRNGVQKERTKERKKETQQETDSQFLHKNFPLFLPPTSWRKTQWEEAIISTFPPFVLPLFHLSTIIPPQN